ncbi:MAG: SDR family oxidoreductase [Burkholderiales bacterium]|nr:SDR family oxidoreductase [Burkholderiales bacterium]
MTTKPTSTRQTALITGASSGIGEALARCCAAAKLDLILVARSEGKLKVLAKTLAAQHGITARVQPADLSQPGAAAQLHAALKRKRCSVDVLVNCAGVLEQGAFTAIAHERHQAIIDLNISGLTAMLSVFVPDMVRRGGGRVLNVASVAAFQPVPTLASYAASKAYVLSLSESLAEELRGTGVTVTALCPGITATNMLTQAAGANDKLGQLPAFLIGDVEAVAAQAFAACMRGDAICVPGVINQAAMLASRGAPKWLVRRIGGLLGRKAL